MFSNREEDNDLLTLVEEDFDDDMSILLESGAEVDLDKVDSNGNTALHLAVLEGHTDVVYGLIMNGANIAIKNTNGQTPLHIASQQNDLLMLKYLLEKRTHTENEKAEHDAICHWALTKKDNNGDTVLHIAAKKNDLDMLTYLLGKGAGVMAVNDKGETALELAIFNHNIAAVKDIVSRNRECLKIKNVNGFTPLHQAVMLQEYEIVKWFLDKAGVSVFEESSHYNVTALTLAARNPNKAMVHILLSRGAGIKADLTGVDLSMIDLSHYVFIGAEENGNPFKCEGIKSAAQLHEANLRGEALNCRALCRAITARLIDDPENQDLLDAQKVVKSYPSKLATRYNLSPIPSREGPNETSVLTSISCKRA